jgi:hypothetical protein
MLLMKPGLICWSRDRLWAVIPTRKLKPYLLYNGQTGSRVHPVSYLIGTVCSLPGGKAAGGKTDYTPPSSAEVKDGGAIPTLLQHVFARARNALLFIFSTLRPTFISLSSFCLI